jgi:hypothetical protein
MPRTTACLFVVIIVLTQVRPASAWSTKEHMLLTRLAAERLIADPATPPAMKEWLLAALGGKAPDLASEKDFFLHARVGAFARGADGIAYWAVYPDLVAASDKTDRKIEPFGAPEAKLHFIDIEYFSPDPARRTYADDLSSKPKLADFPKDINDPRYRSAGMLPFSVERHYQLLVRSIRAGRLNDKPGQFPRDDHATHWAGQLAHYLEDNTQPQHATEDYQSRSYFKSLKDARKAPNIHSDVEFRLLDDEYAEYPELRQELWDKLLEMLDQFHDPVESADPWRSTLEVSLASYDALPTIGRAAVAAYPNATADSPGRWDPAVFFHTRGQYLGKEMSLTEIKAHQLAWAVKRVERLWRAAWDEANRDAAPGQ